MPASAPWGCKSWARGSRRRGAADRPCETGGGACEPAATLSALASRPRAALCVLMVIPLEIDAVVAVNVMGRDQAMASQWPACNFTAMREPACLLLPAASSLLDGISRHRWLNMIWKLYLLHAMKSSALLASAFGRLGDGGKLSRRGTKAAAAPCPMDAPLGGRLSCCLFCPSL